MAARAVDQQPGGLIVLFGCEQDSRFDLKIAFYGLYISGRVTICGIERAPRWNVYPQLPGFDVMRRRSAVLVWVDPLPTDRPLGRICREAHIRGFVDDGRLHRKWRGRVRRRRRVFARSRRTRCRETGE